MLEKILQISARILKLFATRKSVHIWIYFSSEMLVFSSVWCHFAGNNNEWQRLSSVHKKVEDYVIFLESGRKMGWSQKKELQSCGWMYRTKLDGLEQSPTFQEKAEA